MSRLLPRNVLGYVAAGLLPLLLSVPVFSADEPKPKEGDVTFDGLTITKITRSSETQLKKDADWTGYSTYQLVPAQVSMLKNWQRDYNREERDLSSRVSDKDVARIKDGVAKIIDEKFDEALQEKADVKKVAEPDASTIILRPVVVNLDVTAPDVNSAMRQTTYVRSAGSATLVLEVYDAVSGQIIARYMDAREDPENGYADWANRVSNTAAAKQIVNRWAKVMVEGLDQLRSTK